MTTKPLAIEGVYLLRNFVATDERGYFVKTYHAQQFAELGLETAFRESYYSMSVKGVIRGMHFQLPPHDHNKLVYVTSGEILDVVVDLRKNSTTYKQYLTVSLTERSDSIYIPKGCAHGFLTLTDQAQVVYTVSTEYSSEADAGIRWDSFGFDWLDTQEPVISTRDQTFVTLNDFSSPF